MAIPGYKGYVPEIKTGSCVGKRYTEMTRDVMTKIKLDDKTQTLATTG
jgi:hypothetical protein